MPTTLDRREYAKAYREQHRERLKDYFRVYNATPKRRAYQKAWHALHTQSENRRRRYWSDDERRAIARVRAKAHYHAHRMEALGRNFERQISMYGIDRHDLVRLFNEQNGKCAICLRPISISKPRTACIDHDHSSNRVRGLLCRRCNGILGRDTQETLTRIVEYLRNALQDVSNGAASHS